MIAAMQYGDDGKGQRTPIVDANLRSTYTCDADGRQLTATTPNGKSVTK